MERSSGPLPWLWPVVGLLARSGFREFKGWPRDNKTVRPVWPKPPFSSVDRQESQPALVVFTRPQPQAPNLLGATGTGPHAGHDPLELMKGSNQAGGASSVGSMEGVKPSWRRASSVGGRDARSSLVLSGCNGRVTATPTVTVWVRDQ